MRKQAEKVAKNLAKMGDCTTEIRNVTKKKYKKK